MREIKFRGQIGTTEGKKWVYGHYYKVKSFFNDKEGHFIGTIRNDHLTDFSIDENTIGQFTGLKDKNGKEIYEGDIVYIKGETEILDIKGKVEYSETFAEYIITNTGDILSEAEPLGDYDEIEVIGNVYENKDLLEKGKEE